MYSHRVTTYVVCHRRCGSYDISLKYSCFLAVVIFHYEISCLLALFPNTVVSK